MYYNHGHNILEQIICQNADNIAVTFPKLQLNVEHEKPSQA